MRQHLGAFLCALLVGCAITTPATEVPPRFVWDAGTTPKALTDAGDLDNLSTVIAGVQYATDYDLSHYLSASETMARGSGDCTAFARLWMAGLQPLGYKVRMLEIWGDCTPHAECLFYTADPGWWRMTSDAILYGFRDLGPDEHQAALKGAAFYCPNWMTLDLRNASGTVIWTHERIPL